MLLRRNVESWGRERASVIRRHQHWSVFRSGRLVGVLLVSVCRAPGHCVAGAVAPAPSTLTPVTAGMLEHNGGAWGWGWVPKMETSATGSQCADTGNWSQGDNDDGVHRVSRVTKTVLDSKRKDKVNKTSAFP